MLSVLRRVLRLRVGCAKIVLAEEEAAGGGYVAARGRCLGGGETSESSAGCSYKVLSVTTDLREARRGCLGGGISWGRWLRAGGVEGEGERGGGTGANNNSVYSI